MQDFQQRVIEERSQLADRAQKLVEFIELSPIFKGLKRDEQFRLRTQLGVMKLYIGILDERIISFEEPEPKAIA